MEFHFSLYLLPLIAAAISAGAVSAYVWARRAVRSAPALVGLGIAIMIWSTAYALEIGSIGLPAKLTWGKIEYLGIATTPLMWFIFAYNHASRDKLMSPRAMFIASIVPMLTIAFVFSTEQHGLIWQEIGLQTTPDYSVLKLSHGGWFWVHSAYSYGLLLLGSIYVVRAVRHVWGPYRGQAVALLIAVAVPWIVNIFYLSGLSPVRDLDPTPFAFTITLLAMVWGIFGFRLMDLSPVARDIVVEEMIDGMVVLDAQDRVADMNPAAERLLGISAAQTISRPIRDVLSAWPQIFERFSSVTEAVDEITVGTGEAQRWYEVRISPLKDRRARLAGRVITVRNITERRRTEERLLEERNLLRTVIDNVPDQIFVRDLANRFMLSNLSDARAMDVADPETLVGMNDYDFYPPELAARFQADNLAVMQSGQPLLNREERARDVDGNPRWVLTTKVPLRDRLGSTIGLVGIARDITERKQAELFKQAFLDDIKALQELHLQLSEIDHQSMLYVKMIELAQQRLSLDRVRLYLLDAATNELQGTYGVDQIGRVCDERDYREPITFEHWSLEVLNAPSRTVLWDEASLDDGGPGVERGWKVATTLWNGREAVGYLVCDNLLTHRPARPYEAELISLLGSTFGHLIERQQMESALRESEERYRNVAESMTDVVWLLDVNTFRFTYISPSVKRLRGYTVEEVTEQPMEQVMTPESLANIQASMPKRIAAYLAGDELSTTAVTEVEQYRKDGSTVWTEVVTVLQGDAQTGFKILGVSRDISERKLADAQIRQLSRAVEASPTSIVITDVNGVIQYVNPKFTEVTGYSFQEILGQTPRLLRSDLTPREVYPQLWAMIQSGKEWHGEFCNRKKSGELYWEWASISPIVDSAGHISHYVAVKEDVTARKRAQEELALAHEQALAASRYKSELMAKVSHELRTPLGAILGYTEFLHKEMFAPLTPQQKHFTGEILDSVNYLNGLVNDLLDEAQLERGRIQILSALVNVRQMASQLTVIMEPLARAKGLSFSMQVTADVPSKFVGDQKRLRQILTNLINNAIKFTAAGSVEVQIRRPDPQHWLMQVTDTGPGMMPEVQARIFEAFWQADGSTTRHHEGYGLGLSIVKQLTDLMGGELSVQSEVNRGSTFRVVMPLIEHTGS